MMRGAVALARETGVPLVPMALWGGQRIYTARAAATGHQLSLRRGRPITILVAEPRHLGPDREAESETRLLGAQLQGLLDAAQAMHPDQPATGERPPWHPAHLGGSAPTTQRAVWTEQVPRSAIVLERPAF